MSLSFRFGLIWRFFSFSRSFCLFKDFIKNSLFLFKTIPIGISAFICWIFLMISEYEILYCLSFSLLMFIKTSFLYPPKTSTFATFFSFKSWFFIWFSASCLTSARDMLGFLGDTDSTITGGVASVILYIWGSFIPLGSIDFTLLTSFCTSKTA